MKNPKLTKYLIASLTVLLVALILAGAYKFRYKTENIISVTGGAEKDFESDQIVWNTTYSIEASDLQATYPLIQSQKEEVEKYLLSKGLKKEDYIFSSIDISKNYTTSYDNNGRSYEEFKGYKLSQTATVSSKELDKVEGVSRDITELIQKGIQISSSSPSYYYTKLNDLKISLLAEASKDAHKRATVIADNTKGSLKRLRDSKMGVFQITGANSDEDYSYGGVFNTQSRNKKASITVKANYSVR